MSRVPVQCFWHLESSRQYALVQTPKSISWRCVRFFPSWGLDHECKKKAPDAASPSETLGEIKAGSWYLLSQDLSCAGGHVLADVNDLNHTNKRDFLLTGCIVLATAQHAQHHSPVPSVSDLRTAAKTMRAPPQNSLGLS